MDADVIIVGAGLAGLSAARELTRDGREVLVLEAHERVGGRTLTESLGEGRFDMGGQWIGPTQPRMMALAKELGLGLFPTFDVGRKRLEIQGRWSSYAGAIPSMSVRHLLELQRWISKIERLARRVPPGSPQDTPEADRWDAMTVASWCTRQGMSPKVRAMVELLVRAILSTEAEEVSFLYLLLYIRNAGSLDALITTRGGAQQERFVLGAGSVAERMAQELSGRVHTSRPVRAITGREEHVEVVDAFGEVLVGRRCVVTLPPPALSTVRFGPGMSPARAAMARRAAMGATIKCLALYETPFWRERGWSGELLSHSGPATFTFDNTSHDGRQPALVSFVNANHAHALARVSPERRKEQVLRQLARAFGAQALTPSSYHETNWDEVPFAHGCPVATWSPGTLARHGASWFGPQGRIHWAGTETAQRWFGFMEGAVESAARVAREIRQSS